MINFTLATTEQDLNDILELQQANLRENVSQHERESQGFVTVCHSFEQIQNLNKYEKHVIAKHQNKVIAYALAMTAASKVEIPILAPMFDVFDELEFESKKIADFEYILVGQVCVAKTFRSQGVFDDLYEKYAQFYRSKYDFAITEIASSNTRSRKAHARVGFKEIHAFTDSNLINWVIVIWDWKK
jgi:L-amino acid N-acyltransferase YncA